MKKFHTTALLVLLSLSACSVTTKNTPLEPRPPAEEDAILTRVAYRLEAIIEYRGFNPQPLGDAAVSKPFAPPLTSAENPPRAYCVTYRQAAQRSPNKTHVMVIIFNNDLEYKKMLVERGGGLVSPSYCDNHQMVPFPRLVEFRNKRIAELEAKRRGANRAVTDTPVVTPQ